MWFICNPLGSMVSGYLQAAAYTNLSGVGGMPGWRWLFIIDGIFTIPVAIIGYFVFPGIPDSPKPFYLTDEDIALAKERSRRSKIQRPGKLDWDVFRRTVRRWHIWVFVFCYMYASWPLSSNVLWFNGSIGADEDSCMIISAYPFSYMNLWLKARGTYSVTQINNLPPVTYAVQIVVSWLGTTLAAVYPSWVIYSIAVGCCLFSTLCMIIWSIPTGLKYTSSP